MAKENAIQESGAPISFSARQSKPIAVDVAGVSQSHAKSSFSNGILNKRLYRSSDDYDIKNAERESERNYDSGQASTRSSGQASIASQLLRLVYFTSFFFISCILYV